MRTEMNANPSSLLHEKELFVSLEKLINSLSPRQKEVFVMRYYNQLPFKKIAQILQKNLGTVKSNYFFAMQKIKKDLQNQNLIEFRE